MIYFYFCIKILELEPEEDLDTGAAMDATATVNGKCVVIKTSTR